jgi:hypothetical protein
MSPTILNPQVNFIIITLLAGGLVLSNFYDLLDTLQAGNYLASVRQLINLIGILALIWLHYFLPVLK